MNNLEILIPLSAIFIGGLIFLIPIVGLTARYPASGTHRGATATRPLRTQR